MAHASDNDLSKRELADIEKARPVKHHTPDKRTIVYLRAVDAGTDNACWVVCAKGDQGAWAFAPLDFE